MGITALPLADTKHEITFGKNSVHVSIIDIFAAPITSAQRGPEDSNAVAQLRVVLDKFSVVDEVCQPIEIAADEHTFDESPNQSTVAFGLLEVNSLCRPVYHEVSGLIWPTPRLNVVPVLDRSSVFKPENLEPDLSGCEVVLCVREDKITVLESSHDIDSWRSPGQSLKKRGETLTALVCLRVVLNVFGLIDDGDGFRVARFYAFQQRPDLIFLRALHDRD